MGNTKAMIASALAITLFAVLVPPAALVAFGPLAVLLGVGLAVYFLLK